MNVSAIVMLLVVLLALAGGWYSFQGAQSDDEKTGMSVTSAGPADTPGVFSYSINGLDGVAHTLAEWQGKVLVVNFWATWCTPCREEIPLFVELQDQYSEQGLQFIGIAIDEPEAVRDFADEFGVDYPMLVGEHDVMEFGVVLGNHAGTLPYSAIIDRQGRIVSRKHGALQRDEAERILLPLLKREAVTGQAGA